MRDRPLSPHLQVYRWPLSMALSILHRATGVFLTAGVLVLVWWLVAVAAGGETHAGFQRCIESPLGQVALFAWVAALMLHMLNGIRHLLWDIGYGFDKPTTQKTGWAVVIGAVVLTALVWWYARGGAA